MMSINKVIKLNRVISPRNVKEGQRRHFNLVGISTSLAVILFGCEQKPLPAPPLRPALAMVVEEKTKADTMTLVGEILPRYESNQAFRINGKIIERKVEVGANVSKGQLLARLDAADTQLTAIANQADVTAAAANLALAKTEITRYKQLFQRNFVSASALDSKTSEYKTAAAKLKQVQAQAKVAGNQSQYTALIADREGVISLIRAEPGQVVEAGEVVAKIADTRQMDVLVAVPESRMANVKLNQSVMVRSWANRAQTYAGTIREISPIAEPTTRSFNVRVTINHPDAALKFGMTAGVSFQNDGNQTSASVLIPSAALTEVNTKKSVWVIDANNAVQLREVNADSYSETGVEITHGLSAGEKIVIAGVHTLVQGQQVKPIIESMP